MDPNTDAFVFAPDFTGADNCFIVTSATCPNQAAHPFTAQLGDAGLGQVTIGNGYCGEVDAVD